MIEGLWSIIFVSENGSEGGGGVVVFESQRAFGGDTSMHYIGSYEVDRKSFKADIMVKRHNNYLESLIDTDEGRVVIDGSIENKEINGSAYLKDGSDKVLKIKFIKISELP